MIEPRCKHNWITPPECPQCVSDERDELKDKLAIAREAQSEAEQLKATVVRLRGQLLGAVNTMEAAIIDEDWSGDDFRTRISAIKKAMSAASKPATVPRDGNWMDKWGACKVCGGEIPHGHSDSCDIHKLESALYSAKADAEALASVMKDVLVASNQSSQNGYVGGMLLANMESALANYRAKHPAPVVESIIPKPVTHPNRTKSHE